jgi:glycosyltransferase involved in cell wall biosynthesis
MGHAVHVAFLHGGSNLHRLEGGGVALHRIRSRGNHDPGILLRLGGLIRRIRPDLLQTWILNMDVLAGVAARMTGTPLILREPSCVSAYPRTVKTHLREWIGKRADAIIANSDGGASYWRALGGPAALHVIPNGIPLDFLGNFQPASLSGLGVPPDRKVILYAGRFEEGKNLELLVEALSMVIADMPAVAVLAGDGPGMSSIRQSVDRRGMSQRIVLPGFVDNVWAMMKAADVFIFTSVFEGLPNVVLEAMACGCPLVVSDIPAHREFLDGRCALLVNPGAPPEIAQAIRNVLSDSAGARARAEIAKEKVARWSVTAMAAGYETTYREVLERRGCRR